MKNLAKFDLVTKALQFSSFIGRSKSKTIYFWDLLTFKEKMVILIWHIFWVKNFLRLIHVLQHYGDFHFGSMDLKEIHLSQRRASKRSKENYYFPSAVVSLWFSFFGDKYISMDFPLRLEAIFGSLLQNAASGQCSGYHCSLTKTAKEPKPLIKWTRKWCEDWTTEHLFIGLDNEEPIQIDI